MVRRSLGVALWLIVGLLACFLGALSALVGTGAGRGLLARVTESALTHVFTGSIEVGDVRGSLLTGVTLTGVRLLDAAYNGYPAEPGPLYFLDTTTQSLTLVPNVVYQPGLAAGFWRRVVVQFAVGQAF